MTLPVIYKRGLADKQVCVLVVYKFELRVPEYKSTFFV